MSGEFQLVVVCNTIFTGAGMRMAPRASMTDGLLDVLIVRDASRWQLFTRIDRGTHIDLPCVEYQQVRSITIRTDQMEALDIDGEVRGTAPVAVDVMPAAVRIYGEPAGGSAKAGVL